MHTSFPWKFCTVNIHEYNSRSFGVLRGGGLLEHVGEYIFMFEETNNLKSEAGASVLPTHRLSFGEGSYIALAIPQCLDVLLVESTIIYHHSSTIPLLKVIDPAQPALRGNRILRFLINFWCHCHVDCGEA